MVAIALGWTAVRLVIDDPGPAYLLPIGMAAWWFGPLAGGTAGAVCTVLYAVTEGIQREEFSALSAPVVLRFVIYVGAGLAAGVFAQRLRLEQREHRRHLTELRAIQETLTPPLPATLSAVDLAIVYLPAKQGVSGDFHVVTEGPDESIVVVVGDVVGKGLAASQLAWYVRTAIATAAQYTTNPSDILRLANATVLERRVQDDAFVTLGCVVLDLHRRRIRWALAGHPAPILLDTGRFLDGEGALGVPVGVQEAPAYPFREEWLPANGGFVLFTDGMTEAFPSTGGRPDLFGEERIQQIVVDHALASPDDVVTALKERALDHANDVLPDDLCPVAARIR